MEKASQSKFWCFECKKETVVFDLNEDEIACAQCNCTFVEEITESTEHPSAFRPRKDILNNVSRSAMIISSNSSPNQLLSSIGQLHSNFHNLFQFSQPIINQFMLSPNLSNIFNVMVNNSNENNYHPASKDEINSLIKETVDKSTIEKFSQLECAICYENFKEGEVVNRLRCGHHHHLECILIWLEKHNNCPVCRYKLQTDS